MSVKQRGYRLLRNLLRCFTLSACLLTAACSYFNETRFENSLGKDVDLISFSYDIADDLVSSAFPPLVPRHPDLPILTTTFVDNNDLQQTSHFGRLLQDHIGSRFVQAGFAVKEIRLRDDLVITPKSGETMLSRQRHLLKQSRKAQALLVGTTSMKQRTMYITARLVNPVDSSVIAAKNYRLFMDKNVLAMYNLKVGSTGDETIQQPSEPLFNRILY